MVTETKTRDKVQEIIDLTLALALEEELSRPEAAWRVIDQKFPTLQDVVRDFVHYGLVQRLGVDNHINNKKAAQEGPLPAANEPWHLKLAYETVVRIGFWAFLDEYMFIGVEGIQISLGDAQYDDLDCRGNAEAAQATARQAVSEAFFALRDAVGKDRSVRDLSKQKLQPLVEALRKTLA